MRHNRAIRWKRQFRDPIVWISVAKLDRSWRRDTPYYVGPAVSGLGNGERCKYDRFGEWFAAGKTIEMPHVSLCDGHISFSNGRHRFAWLRDHGVRVLPVTVSPSQQAQMKREFGSRSRVSRFPLRQRPRIPEA